MGKEIALLKHFVRYNYYMVTYYFGENYENPKFGVFWQERNSDYTLYHSHNYWELVICKEGIFEHNVNNVTNNLNKGDAVLLAPGDGHSLKGISEQVILLNIGIENDTFIKKCNTISPTFYNFFTANHPLKTKFSLERFKKIESLLKNVLISNDNNEVECLINFVLFNIFEPIYTNHLNQKNEMPEWFKDLLIQCNSLEHLDWKPRDVCAYANYSQAHINRLFRKLLNTSLIDYLINIKMNNAIVLLTTSDMSLSAIVDTLGYNSVSYFTHTFKKFYKISPYQYKLNFQGNKKKH